MAKERKRAARRSTRQPSKRKAVDNTAKEISTEAKIKEAARKLFTQKGFAATRTRDIAEEAGINLALLNYYFRSKQKLFDIIMFENFQQFMHGISVNVMNDQAGLHEKIETVIASYIDFLTQNPHLPLFILNELKNGPSRIAEKMDKEIQPVRTQLFQRLQEAAKEGKVQALNPFHFIANLVALAVFPFISRPILQRITKVTDEEFNAFMQERKTLVPLWISGMLQPGQSPKPTGTAPENTTGPKSPDKAPPEKRSAP